MLSDSSLSSSHHSIPAPQEEVTNSRRPAKKKDKDPLVYYARTPHTRPKKKLHHNSKLIDNPRLRDLIINVGDPPPEKKENKTVRKNRAKIMKPVKTKEMDGLELLSAALDSLK